jgi:hypothetical protein
MLRASPEPNRNNPLTLAKAQMSIPNSTPNPAPQEHNCAGRETYTVYSVACDDSRAHLTKRKIKHCKGSVILVNDERSATLSDKAERPEKKR